MNSEQLRYFSILYANRSYSAAAHYIPMTKQGLIKAIKSLEQELGGIELFVQMETGLLEPTPYAQVLNLYANNWQKEELILHESFKRLYAQQRHEIRIGATMGQLGMFGPEFLSGLYLKHPDLSLSYKEHDDEETDRGLRLRFYELAITLFPFDVGFVTTELFSTPTAYWVPANDPLACRPSISVGDLDGRSIGWTSKGYKISQTLKELCVEKGVQLAAVYESEQMFVLFEFARRGKGLAFTTPQIAALPVFATHEEVVCVPSTEIVLRCGLSYLPSYALTEPEQRFYDYCVSFARDNLKYF